MANISFDYLELFPDQHEVDIADLPSLPPAPVLTASADEATTNPIAMAESATLAPVSGGFTTAELKPEASSAVHSSNDFMLNNPSYECKQIATDEGYYTVCYLRKKVKKKVVLKSVPDQGYFSLVQHRFIRGCC